MTPEEHRALFTDALHEWLDENGVIIVDIKDFPFNATVDINKLKLGMCRLIRAFGGDL